MDCSVFSLFKCKKRVFFLNGFVFESVRSVDVWTTPIVNVASFKVVSS